MPKQITQSIEEQLKANTRAIKEVSSRVEMLDSRLDILDDILLRLGLVQEGQILTHDKAKDMTKDLRADIKAVEFAVENKVDEVKDVVSGSEHIMVKKGYFDKIKMFIKK